MSLLAFVAGYNVSSKTGVEPGYFQATETGSYGGSKDGESVKGVSEEDSKYYKGLAEE